MCTVTQPKNESEAGGDLAWIQSYLRLQVSIRKTYRIFLKKRALTVKRCVNSFINSIFFLNLGISDYGDFRVCTNIDGLQEILLIILKYMETRLLSLGLCHSSEIKLSKSPKFAINRLKSPKYALNQFCKIALNRLKSQWSFCQFCLPRLKSPKSHRPKSPQLQLLNVPEQTSTFQSRHTSCLDSL